MLVDHNVIVNAHVTSEGGGGHEESLSCSNTTNFEISYNDISMNGYDGQLGNEGIDCKEASQYGKVHHNYVHGYNNDGGGIYLDAWDKVNPGLTNIQIYCNRSYNNANGIMVGSEQGGTTQYCDVFNNVIYNTGSSGIMIPERSGDGLRQYINIYHNTIYLAQWNGGAAIYCTETNVNHIYIRDNITYFSNYNGEIVAGTDAIGTLLYVDHNLSFGPTDCADDYPSCLEMSTNPGGYPNIFSNLTGDPKFVNLSTPDLHLQSSSPARGAGVTSALVTTDFDGKARANPPCIGAFEY